MRRNLFLIVTAFAVMLVGFVVAVWIDQRALASETFDIAGEKVHVRITADQGLLYVTSRQLKAWGGGWESQALLGEESRIGRTDPSFSRDASTGRITLHVGTLRKEFEPQSHYWRDP